MAQIPLVFIHTGRSMTLTRCVEVASYYSNSVIVIGDKQALNLITIPTVDLVDIVNYLEGIDEFKRDFVNLSTNNANFEFMCFARWIIVNSYLESMQISRAWILDSDLMFFANGTDLATKSFHRDKATLSLGTSGHCCLFDKEFLDEFVRYFKGIYKRKAGSLCVNINLSQLILS
jgi:hypothetical protein